MTRLHNLRRTASGCTMLSGGSFHDAASWMNLWWRTRISSTIWLWSVGLWRWWVGTREHHRRMCGKGPFAYLTTDWLCQVRLTSKSQVLLFPVDGLALSDSWMMIIHFPWTHFCSTKFCRLPQKGKMGYEVITIAAGSCVHQPGFESFTRSRFRKDQRSCSGPGNMKGCMGEARLFVLSGWLVVGEILWYDKKWYLNLSEEKLLVLKSAEDLSQGDDPQIPNDFPNNFLWHPVDHFFFISMNHWTRLASMEYQWISIKKTDNIPNHKLQTVQLILVVQDT